MLFYLQNYASVFKTLILSRDFWGNKKQPSRGVPRKKCSGNMQQGYATLLKSHSAWVFSCKFTAYFQNNFFRNTFGRLLLGNIHHVRELNHISPENLIKDSYLLKKQIKRGFWRRKTAKDGNVKIMISPNIPCIFLLLESSAFLKVFFLKITSFNP